MSVTCIIWVTKPRKQNLVWTFSTSLNILIVHKASQSAPSACLTLAIQSCGFQLLGAGKVFQSTIQVTTVCLPQVPLPHSKTNAMQKVISYYSKWDTVKSKCQGCRFVLKEFSDAALVELPTMPTCRGKNLSKLTPKPFLLYTYWPVTAGQQVLSKRERVSNARHGHKVSIYRYLSQMKWKWGEHLLVLEGSFHLTLFLEWKLSALSSYHCITWSLFNQILPMGQVNCEKLWMSVWNSFPFARRPPLTLHHSQSLCFWWSIRPRCRHWANAQDDKSE